MLSGIVLPFQGGGHLDAWHATYLGRRRLPSELTAFELEAFFSFSDAERRTIEQRREPALRLSLALQIGFLRMSGRLRARLRGQPAPCAPAGLRRGRGYARRSSSSRTLRSSTAWANGFWRKTVPGRISSPSLKLLSVYPDM